MIRNEKMSLKMKYFLRKESTLRILSIFFAIFLWFFVNDEINPMVTEEVTVPLTIKNENVLSDQGLTLVNKNIPKNISVVLKGRKLKSQAISLENVDAWLNLEQISAPSKGLSLPIEVVLDQKKIEAGFVVDNYSPKTVQVDVEKTGKNLFKIELVQTGALREGYKLIQAQLTPDTISLQGGATFFSTVHAVKVFVDLNGLDHDFTTNKECRIFDKAGKEIIQANLRYPVTVSLEIAKELPLIPVISGKPEDGYVEITRQSNPEKVLLKGAPEVLDMLDNIRTETLYIDGIRESIQKKVNFVLPNGVKAIHGNTQSEVSIKVERLTEKTFQIEANAIKFVNTRDGLRYRLLDAGGEIELTGPKQALEQFKPESLNLTMDVSNASEGENTLALKFTLPQGLKQKREAYGKVFVETQK